MAKNFGLKKSTEVDVLITSTTLSAANPLRKHILLQNKDTTNFITVHAGADAATAANGIKVLAGATLDIFHPGTGAYTAIANGGTVKVVVIEEDSADI